MQAVLLSASTNAESISPRHGVLESDTTIVIEVRSSRLMTTGWVKAGHACMVGLLESFCSRSFNLMHEGVMLPAALGSTPPTQLCVQDVEFSYTTCKTRFNGEEGQAVFASIVNDTELGTAKALCLLRVPFQDEEHLNVEAHIEVSQAQGPSAKLEKFSTFKVDFSQAPVVTSGSVQYASGQRYGSVIVQISHIDGFLTVRASSGFCDYTCMFNHRVRRLPVYSCCKLQALALLTE